MQTLAKNSEEYRAWILRQKVRLRAESIARYGEMRCHYCRRHITKKDWTVDHVSPRCQGGQEDGRNAVLACRTCNVAKGGMTLPEFADWLLSAADGVYSMLAALCDASEAGKGVTA